MEDIGQNKLWHDDIYDALDTIVKVLGGKAAVGVMLKPELNGKPGTAEGWVKDCLNRNNKSDFKPQQLIHLLAEARKKGCHVGMYQVCDEADYQRPQPIEPEDEMARLERQILASNEQTMQMMRRFESMVKLKQESS